MKWSDFHVCYLFLKKWSGWVGVIVIVCFQSQAKIALANPASPDQEIPPFLRVLKNSEVTINASSTARGFDVHNLLKNQGWLAWGSELNDRYGAWLSLQFNQIYYVSFIHFVPGDEREKNNFKRCGRPAKIEISTSKGELRKISLDNRRYHQYIRFDPPLMTRDLQITFKTAFGPSITGGICLAALMTFVHSDPLKSINGLKSKIDKAISFLKKPLLREQGEESLRQIGSIALPILLSLIKDSSKKEQAILLKIIASTSKMNIIDTLRKLESVIHPLNLTLYQWTLASLGDQTSMNKLLEGIDELTPKKQAKRLEAIARAGDKTHLPLLLKSYGFHFEIDEALRPLFPKFYQAYTFALKAYLTTKGQRKSAFLELLASLNPRRATPFIEEALSQNKDPMWRSGVIKGTIYLKNKKFRPQVRALKDSVYVVERKAVAKALSHWGEPVDQDILRVLTTDRSMSVREVSITGLGRFTKAHHLLLKKYALQGSDEPTAEAAAKSWLNGTPKTNIKLPLDLLTSSYERVRRLGLMHILDHGQNACEPLTSKLFYHEVLYEEMKEGLRELWPICFKVFVQKSMKTSKEIQVRVLSLIQEWSALEGEPLIRKALKAKEESLQVAAIFAAETSLSSELTQSLLKPLLRSSADPVRCGALEVLARFKDQSIQASVKKVVLHNLREPKMGEESWLLCHLKAAGILKIDQLAPVLNQAYHSWRRSIAFAVYRKAAIKAISNLNHPDRLSALMEAMSDIDPTIRKLAERGLRRK